MRLAITRLNFISRFPVVLRTVPKEAWQSGGGMLQLLHCHTPMPFEQVISA
jgi:hypothetical protein